MGHRPRILVCEHDVLLSKQLSHTFEAAGFWVDIAHTAQQALKKLATRQYQAMTLNLLLEDQDALSFSHELRVLGMRLPILVISASTQPKTAPRLMCDSEVNQNPASDYPPEPDWVRKAADQARFIFAVKSACQRSRGFYPRILHVEADRFSASLVKAALRDSVDLIQAGDNLELDEALEAPSYDLALLNPEMVNMGAEEVLHRIVALCPDIPVIMHTRYQLTQCPQDIPASETQTGPQLITALRTLLLHAMQVPLRAQA